MRSSFERYRKGEASLGRAAELAGVPLGQMMTILTEFGVEGGLSPGTRESPKVLLPFLATTSG